MLKSIFPKTQEMDGASERNRMEWEKLLSKERFYHSGDREESGRNDYDTIIRSTLFRRLQDKAQVFPLEADDYVRTRLTHSPIFSQMLFSMPYQNIPHAHASMFCPSQKFPSVQEPY